MKKFILFIAIFVISMAHGFATGTATAADNSTAKSRSASSYIVCNVIEAVNISTNALPNLGTFELSKSPYPIGQSINITIAGEPGQNVQFKTTAVASNDAVTFNGSFSPTSSGSVRISSSGRSEGASILTYTLDSIITNSTTSSSTLNLTIEVSFNDL